MLRSIVVSILMISGFAGCTAVPPQNDPLARNRVLRTLLAHEAERFSGSTDTICVMAEMKRSLDLQRRFLKRDLEGPFFNPKAAKLTLTGKGIEWFKPSPKFAGEPIAPEMARNLETALARAMIIESEAEPQTILPPSTVPKPFRYAADAKVHEGERRAANIDCSQSLSITEPAITGDFAFVEDSFECGELCGSGGIVALQRTYRGWKVVAISNSWTS